MNLRRSQQAQQVHHTNGPGTLAARYPRLTPELPAAGAGSAPRPSLRDLVGSAMVPHDSGAIWLMRGGSLPPTGPALPGATGLVALHHLANAAGRNWLPEDNLDRSHHLVVIEAVDAIEEGLQHESKGLAVRNNQPQITLDRTAGEVRRRLALQFKPELSGRGSDGAVDAGFGEQEEFGWPGARRCIKHDRCRIPHQTSPQMRGRARLAHDRRSWGIVPQVEPIGVSNEHQRDRVHPATPSAGTHADAGGQQRSESGA
jgi:hypothetical protein